MNGTSKSKKSEKSQTNTSSFSRMLKPQKQMLVANSKSPGMGLWCTSTTKEPVVQIEEKPTVI